MTTVVSLKGRHRENGGLAPPGVVYIGGRVTMGGWRLGASEWANPWRPGRDGDRAAVLARYREYVLSTPRLAAALPELRGKTLACWCHPLPCHGHVLAELADADGVAGTDSAAD